MIEVKDIYAASNNGLILYYITIRKHPGVLTTRSISNGDRTKMTLPLVSRGSAMCIR